MPYPVSNLVENRGKPVSATLEMPVTEALSLMLENDFSQLPVIDGEERPLGIITYNEITRTLWYVNRPIEELKVYDTYEQISRSQKVREDENLFDVLDQLRDKNTVLVVNGKEQLIGIITSYDATEYFRLRAEDMMHVEDIEGTIKDLIQVAFVNSDGETNIEKLNEAVIKVASSNQPTKADYAKALARYLELAGSGKPESSSLEKSYEEKLKQPTKVPEFQDLTLYDYIQILLHPDQNRFFRKVFPYTQSEIRKLLNGVCETRNALAHFREVKPAQRDQLIYCKNLLERTMLGIPVNWPLPNIIEGEGKAHEETVVRLEPMDTSTAPVALPVQTLPMDEEVSASDSKYTALVLAIQNKSQKSDQVKFTFDDIDNILDGGLPPSARTHRAWWANDSVGHVQSQLWLEAGWRTSYINMSGQLVTFTRIRGREKAYIAFFSKLINELQKKAKFSIRQISPDGTNWVICQTVASPVSLTANYSYSFALRKRFRVELYLDTGEQKTTKEIFDRIVAHRVGIEEVLGDVSWERIDSKRASRIALYHAGAITDTEEQLSDLRAWAVPKMIDFYNTIEPFASQVVKEVLGT